MSKLAPAFARIIGALPLVLDALVIVSGVWLAVVFRDLKYVGYAIYALCVLVTISWIVGIRTYTLLGSPPTRPTVNTTMLFVVSLVVVPLLSLSPFHLLWMFIASWVLGILSLAFPLSLLSLPGRWFYVLACIGLDREQAQRNQERVAKIQEVVAREGVTPERARQLLIERGEW